MVRKHEEKTPRALTVMELAQRLKVMNTPQLIPDDRKILAEVVYRLETLRNGSTLRREKGIR